MEDFTFEDVMETVKDGAAWLDSNYPGWQAHINLSELNMGSCSSCVIGQAVGEYYDAISYASCEDGYNGDEDQWAIDHGFQSPNFMTFDEEMEEWDHNVAKEASYYLTLEELWTDEVKARFNKGMS